MVAKPKSATLTVQAPLASSTMVTRIEVPVDDIPAMEEYHGSGDLEHDALGHLDRKRHFVGRFRKASKPVPNEAQQASSSHQLHNNVKGASGRARPKDKDNVWMPQICMKSGFVPEGSLLFLTEFPPVR
jgi:hypothetical protein